MILRRATHNSMYSFNSDTGIPQFDCTQSVNVKLYKYQKHVEVKVEIVVIYKCGVLFNRIVGYYIRDL